MGYSPFAPISHPLVASTHPPPLRNEPSGTGSASVTKALTVQGVGALTAACTSTTGLKAANLGPTEGR
jgi:hypothetical protein